MINVKHSIVQNGNNVLATGGSLLLAVPEQFILISKEDSRHCIRHFSVAKDWDKILSLCSREKLKLVIANLSITPWVLVNENIIDKRPSSTTGQLLSILYHRFSTPKMLNGGVLTIMFTHLDQEGEERLRALMMEMAHLNGLDYSFLDWLEQVKFCTKGEW